MDIIERLDHWFGYEWLQDDGGHPVITDSDWDTVAGTMKDAADEIERLREKLKESNAAARRFLKELGEQAP